MVIDYVQKPEILRFFENGGPVFGENVVIFRTKEPKYRRTGRKSSRSETIDKAVDFLQR